MSIPDTCALGSRARDDETMKKLLLKIMAPLVRMFYTPTPGHYRDPYGFRKCEVGDRVALWVPPKAEDVLQEIRADGS